MKLISIILWRLQVVNICVWVLASAFGIPAMVMGNIEEEQEHNSKSLKSFHTIWLKIQTEHEPVTFGFYLNHHPIRAPPTWWTLSCGNSEDDVLTPLCSSSCETGNDSNDMTIGFVFNLFQWRVGKNTFLLDSRLDFDSWQHFSFSFVGISCSIVFIVFGHFLLPV